MSYPQKRTLVTIFAMTLIYAAYWIYASSNLQIGDPLNNWAITMLIFGGVTVIAMVIVQILFHIFLSVGIAVRETVMDPNVDGDKISQSVKREFIEDERDRMLALKSSQVGSSIYGIGFFAGLISLVFYAPPALMLNIVFAAGFLGSVIEGVVNLIYYRRGFSNV